MHIAWLREFLREPIAQLYWNRRLSDSGQVDVRVKDDAEVDVLVPLSVNAGDQAIDKGKSKGEGKEDQWQKGDCRVKLSDK